MYSYFLSYPKLVTINLLEVAYKMVIGEKVPWNALSRTKSHILIALKMPPTKEFVLVKRMKFFHRKINLD